MPGTDSITLLLSKALANTGPGGRACDLGATVTHTYAAECFDVEAAAANLVHLTELCLRDCDPHLMHPKFPGAALGRVSVSMNLWCRPRLDPCDTALWRVQWWSSADGAWEELEDDRGLNWAEPVVCGASSVL